MADTPRIAAHPTNLTLHFIDAAKQAYCGKFEAVSDRLDAPNARKGHVLCKGCIHEYMLRERQVYISQQSDDNELQQSHYAVRGKRFVCGVKIPEEVVMFPMEEGDPKATCRRCLGSPRVPRHFTNEKEREEVAVRTAKAAINQGPQGALQGRPQVYPWADWFDGKEHWISKDVEFDIPVYSMRTQITNAAKRYGFKIRTRIVNNDIWFGPK